MMSFSRIVSACVVGWSFIQTGCVRLAKVSDAEPSAIFSGVHGGNGGDPRILKLSKARIEAANWVGKVSIRPELLASNTDANIKNLVGSEEFLRDLAADIMASPHRFLETSAANPQANSDIDRCAWTNDPTEATLDTIRFDLAKCDSGLTQDGRTFANLTLIHESLHHMVRKLPDLEFASVDKEEAFCNDAALAIATAFETIVEDGTPFWQDVSLDGNPSARGNHGAVWTGETGSPQTSNRMAVWGGCSEATNSIYGCGKYFGDGALYSPVEDKWLPMKSEGAPEARAYHSMIWTGATQGQANRIVVWGGCSDGDGCSKYLASGGVYDTSAQKWSPVRENGAPKARIAHSSVWTGSEMIVWGGEFGGNTQGQQSAALNTGGRYSVGSDTWKALAVPSIEMLAPRRDHTAIYTGTNENSSISNKMLVWGGCHKEVVLFCDKYFGDGAVYDPSTDSWKTMSTINAPSGRRFHSAVWTGKLMVVWGGEDSSGTVKTGAAYDPAQDKWFAINSLGPSARSRHTAVWTGGSMIVFGGENASDQLAADISTFSLPVSFGPGATGKWKKVEVEFDPIKVKGHSAVWSGDKMIIWGGQARPNSFYNTGAMFHPGN